MDVAVAFCIYNRPELTQQVFERIRRERPRRLLVISDGPHRDRPHDRELVAACRNIISQCDWDCDIDYCLAESNMGCRDRMATGLSWAFEKSESLVVLEDDCLPGEDFFPFVTEMLERYRDDDRVMMISGDNFAPQANIQQSYYFSRWSHIWGWASWRRAWHRFDSAIRSWPQYRATGTIGEWTDSPAESSYWQSVFDSIHAGQIDTWDFSWMYACWQYGGLTILPSVNLISNIGFGPSATHTTRIDSPLSNLSTKPLRFPLIHPQSIERNIEADRWTWENIFAPNVPPSNALRKPRSKRRILGRIRDWTNQLRKRA